jgi:hypothetical protein
MRKSTWFIGLLVMETALLAVFFLHAEQQRRAAAPDITASAKLVHELALTDLCLFTEARYTRNPTQADRHAAFQDGPLSLEHFPSGSLLAPPKGLRTTDADLD